MRGLYFLGLFISLILSSCEATELPKEKYCGQELSNSELQKLIEQKNKKFNYSDKDMDKLADITTEVQALFRDTIIIEVFFFMSDKNKVGIDIIGLDNQIVVEKISCLLLSSKYDKVLPKDRFILFFCNEHENLVAGIRNKK